MNLVHHQLAGLRNHFLNRHQELNKERLPRKVKKNCLMRRLGYRNIFNFQIFCQFSISASEISTLESVAVTRYKLQKKASERNPPF